MIAHKDHFETLNGIRLHWIQYESDKPTILLLHGLTANAHAFDGIVNAGLNEHFNIISLDQRGRGMSAKTAFKYTIKNHAEDVIALLNHLNLKKVILCGHSFGGLLSAYLAYYHAHRFSQVIILDAAPEMNPKAAEMLGTSLARIDKRYANFETYIEVIKKAPYITFWDAAMETYYKADVHTAEDDSVEPRSNLADILQVAKSVSVTNWKFYFEQIQQPVLLVVALDNYTMNMPLLPDVKAKETASNMKHATYVEVHGNHQTMLYGQYAEEIAHFIIEFVNNNTE